jgi:hypothetical protein
MSIGAADRLADERMVLDDIFRRTGLRFRHLASIDRNDHSLIVRILPIAKEWVDSASTRITGGLYAQFMTPLSLPYLEDVLRWASKETDPVDREILTQILRLLVTSRTARRIWEVFRGLAPTQSDPLLLAKLAKSRSVSDEVVIPILEYLRSASERIDRGERIRMFGMGVLGEYSRVRHPKVREWFSRHVDSDDPDLRLMARRTRGLKTELPKSCQVYRESPNPKALLFSTEIDSDSLGTFVQEKARELGFEALPGERCNEIVENLSEQHWVVCDLGHRAQGPLEIWLRLEDQGTIQVWIVQVTVGYPN